MKKTISLILLITTVIGFSQEKKTNPYFEETLNKQTVKFNKQTNFRKTKTFFWEKKWGFSLV